MVKIVSIISLFLGLMLMSGTASGATIDLTKNESVESNVDIENTVFGVNFEGLYYTVVMDGDVVTKIELGGNEQTEFNITTDVDTVVELAQNYNSMSWVQMIGFLINRIGIPNEYLLKFT